MRRPATIAVVLVACGGLAAAADRDPTIRVDPELTVAPSWTVPALAETRRRAVSWARDAAGAEAATRVGAIWDGLAAAESGGDVVDAAMETVVTVDPRAAEVRAAAEPSAAAGVGWLDGSSAADFGRDAVRLWLGRELVRRGRFDEALPILADLDVAAAVDPAALLFHRGCCEHWLLQREAAIESFDRLLEREADLPARYASLARLLRTDIAAVEAESLDHVARRMRDVRRRLDLGHAGAETRRVQRGLVDSLDKLIEDLEQEQQQQDAQAGSSGIGGGGQGGVGRPMDDSRIVRGLGKGEVRKRDLGEGAGWGDLPPHEREAALQQIGREYPAHYREAIEEYFKRLATGGEGSP